MSNFWQDLFGTSKTSFRIGKNNLNIDATLATALRQLKLPNANVDFSGGSVGQVMTQQPGGNFLPQSVGGGAGTYLVGPVALSGTYNGDVYVNGNVTGMTTVIIYGNLHVYGTITGFDGNIAGDVIVRGSISSFAGAPTIAGNLIATSTISGLQGTISGNIICGSTLTGNNSGTNLICRGNVLAGNYIHRNDSTKTISGSIIVVGSIDIGSDAGFTPAGITCYGDVICGNSFSCINLGNGASSSTISGDLITPQSINFNGNAAAGTLGRGCNLTVYGNVSVGFEIRLYGNNGGAGGSLVVNGNCYTKATGLISTNGSQPAAGNGGAAGNVTIGGICVTDSITMNGGSGSTGADNAASPGILSLRGGCNIKFIELQDGAFGIAPSDSTKGLRMNGSVNIGRTTITNRTGITISLLDASFTCTAKIVQLVGKNIFKRGVYNAANSTLALINPHMRLYSWDGLVTTQWYEYVGAIW